MLGTPAHGDDQYVELRPGGAILALVNRRAAKFMHGGAWEAAANRSAILEFSVDDVGAERERLEGFVTDWIQEPKDMAWGNRSTLFRDPDGNAINFFKLLPKA